MMTYKGYRGSVRFGDVAEIFHGEITGMRDVVTFQGRTVDELKTAFRESIDDYLEFCESRGEAPDKPYSGRFLLRVDPALHRHLVELSGDEGESLNNWIVSRLQSIVGTHRDGQTARRMSPSGHPASFGARHRRTFRHQHERCAHFRLHHHPLAL